MDPKLRVVSQAARRVRGAEERLERGREVLYDAILDARAKGLSISEIARAAQVTRQAVQQIIQRRSKH